MSVYRLCMMMSLCEAKARAKLTGQIKKKKINTKPVFQARVNARVQCSAQKCQRQHFSEHFDTRTMKIGSGGWAGHYLREGDVSNPISVERCSASTARRIL